MLRMKTLILVESCPTCGGEGKGEMNRYTVTVGGVNPKGFKRCPDCDGKGERLTADGVEVIRAVRLVGINGLRAVPIEQVGS